MSNDTETILTSLCTTLLRLLGLPEHIEITEYPVPPCGDAPEPETRETCHLATCGLDLPTVGRTRIEALGWTLAQALARVGPTNPVAIATQAALTEHGIVIPTREEYERKVAEHEALRLCSFSPPTVH